MYCSWELPSFVMMAQIRGSVGEGHIDDLQGDMVSRPRHELEHQLHHLPVTDLAPLPFAWRQRVRGADSL
jgi:hypothetical protein